MLEWMMTPHGWAAFATLFAMEVVLGIDNIIFISIIAGKLPRHLQQRARMIGLSLALIMRVALLMTLTWIMGLTKPLMTLFNHPITGKDLVLLLGGLFLVAKATLEIHHTVEAKPEKARSAAATAFGMAIAQIVAVDIVFSLDSIITAVGLTRDVGVMISAVVASMAVMVVAAAPVSDFINRHPTTKMLALAFLVMIGMMLMANGFGYDVPKAYVYTAMAFSVLVEGLNVLVRSRTEPVGAMVGAASPAQALEGLLARAQRQGASAIQLASEGGARVRAWLSTDQGLIEDLELPAVDWTGLESELRRRGTAPGGWSERLGGRSYAVKAALTEAGMTPAGLITWAPRG